MIRIIQLNLLIAKILLIYKIYKRYGKKFCMRDLFAKI